MEVEIVKELFSEIAKDFDFFLTNEENDRLVLSGKYGSGKTTFLKLFFEDSPSLGVSEKRYKVFRISPVNYSVSVNEDIIEFIKYDLIIQFLLDGEIKILDSDLPLNHFITEKDVSKIFQILLSVISFNGVEVENLLTSLKSFKSKLEDRKLNINEGDSFSNFLDEIESKSSIFQRDLITKMIENVFARLNKDKWKSILILDDLDRMDPEHVFRILNVFSAHFDEEIFNKRGLKNKFGFDKMIVVCDYNNIQSLFKCKYGKEADFNGYFDKFYKNSVIDFNIKSQIEQYFKGLLYKMDREVIDNYGSNFRYFGSSELFEKTIVNSILLGFLTIRKLNTLININVDAQYKKLNTLFFVRNSRDQNIYTTFLIKLNLFLFDGIDNLIVLLEKLRFNNVMIEIDPYLSDWIYRVANYKRGLTTDNNDIEAIKTETNTFEFNFNENKYAFKIYNRDTPTESLTLSESYDVIEFLLRKIKRLTGAK